MGKVNVITSMSYTIPNCLISYWIAFYTKLPQSTPQAAAARMWKRHIGLPHLHTVNYGTAQSLVILFQHVVPDQTPIRYEM